MSEPSACDPAGRHTLPVSSSAHRRLALFGVATGLWFVAVAVKGVIRPAVSLLQGPVWLRLVLGSTPSRLGGLSVPLCFLAFHPRPGVDPATPDP